MSTLEELVGREQELALIDRVLDQLGDEAFAVEVSGEPGIGKTHLTMEVMARAASKGHQTLSGRASEFEANVPFGLFADALDDHVLADLASVTETLPGETVQGLARVLPSLAPWPGLNPPDRGMERHVSHRAVRRVLEHIASDRPLTLVLDDCHWADPASVELLQHLLRHPPQATVLILISFRANQVPNAIVSELERSERSGKARRLGLLPLELREATQVLPAELDEHTVKRLWQQSGGNPFYLVELARGIASSADRVVMQGSVENVPDSVSEAIEVEVDALGDAARSLLEAAAVVGDPFEYSLASHVADLQLPDNLEELEVLIESDLVRLSGTPERYRFRHPIVRNAVYRSIGESARSAAHRRAAGLLESRGAPVSLQARHVEQYAQVGDEEAVDLLTKAAHDDAARAPATAATFFEAALRLLPERDTGSQREMELLTGMAVALGSSGALEESRATLHRVLEVLPQDASVLRIRAIAFVALVEHLLGNHDDAQRLLGYELDQLPADAAEASEIKVELASGCFFSADWKAMQRWSSEVVDSHPDDPLLTTMAASLLSLAALGLGSSKEAAKRCDQAAQLADKISYGELAARLEACCWLGWAQFSVGQTEPAMSQMRRAAEVARATGQEHLTAAMLVVEAMGFLAVGEVDQAIEMAETAIDSASLSGNHLFLTWALTVRCMCELATGSTEKAIALGQQATEAGIRTRSPWSKVASCYLAEAWLESGDADRCRRELLLPGGSLNFPPFPYYETRCLETLTRAEIALGRLDQARNWAESARAVATKSGLAIHAVESQRAIGLSLLHSGSSGAAIEPLEAAIQTATQAGFRIEAARARILLAEANRAEGNDVDADRELRQAEDELRACGAMRYHRDARSRSQIETTSRSPKPPLVKAGRATSRFAPSSSVLELTVRESEVAHLINLGHTNKEIAANLSLSEKTVETYVSRMFTKLGVSSRSEIAVLVERARSAVT